MLGGAWPGAWVRRSRWQMRTPSCLSMRRPGLPASQICQVVQRARWLSYSCDTTAQGLNPFIAAAGLSRRLPRPRISREGDQRGGCRHLASRGPTRSTARRPGIGPPRRPAEPGPAGRRPAPAARPRGSGLGPGPPRQARGGAPPAPSAASGLAGPGSALEPGHRCS